MDNAYTYDAVSNVLGVANGAALPQSGKAGGQMSHSYTYDALYRLSGATGTYTGADGKTAGYTLSMGYDNMHRITSKSQHLTQANLQFDGTLNVGYDLTYTYGQEEGKKFQLANVGDVNYRTETTPGEDGKVTNSHAYEYDANGNLVYVNTGRVKKDGGTDEKARERKLKWDEENRLLASDDDGFVTNYWYDADGERTVKTSGESEQVYVNSGFAGGRTNTAKFSLYVSPYLVANQGGRYTKHIYIGGERIVSKIGDFASYGPDPRRIEYAGSEADAVTVDYDVKYSQQLQAIKDNYATFSVPYNGTDNDDYVNGEGFCCDDGSLEAAQAKMVAQANALDGNFQEGDAYENLQFYYHADHLGSTSYITNLDGEVVQHVEYVPFGEVFIEERNNTWNTPYLFNAKEFDEETGLYYYGARYYDPRLGLWMSVDPLQEKYPNITSYCYNVNNPIRFVDSDGHEPTPAEAARIAAHVYGDKKDDILTGGWRVSQRDFGIKLTDETSLRSLVYERVVDGKVTEYVYATAGSVELRDWGENFKQPLGLSKQYENAANNAKTLSKILSDTELNFVGHSLGGGEAALNSLVTSDDKLKGRKAFTFNAAGVSDITKISEGTWKTPFKSERKIEAYILITDPLNALQNKFSLMPDVNGIRHYLFPKDLPSVYNGHSIDNIIKNFGVNPDKYKK